MFEQVILDLESDFKNFKEGLLEELKAKTPVDTGTARDGWRIENDEIVNDVPYIGVLETGNEHHRPIGMVSTTLIDVEQILQTAVQKHE